MVVRMKGDRQAAQLKRSGGLRWCFGRRSVVGFLMGVALASGGSVLCWSRVAQPASGSSGVSPDRPSSKVDSGEQIRSLYELLSLSEAELEQVDIALMNLLCAQGLKGAEGISIEQCLARIDEWAQKVKRDTEARFRNFYRNPGKYDNSQAVFQMINLALTLKNDFGVHYNLEAAKDWDFSDSKDIFIHGLLDDRRAGTCTSLPVLCIAIGRELGYPLKLVHAKQHSFVRWEDERERFNIEVCCPGVDIRSDEYYKRWPHEITELDFRRGVLLKSLTAKEELAAFLASRSSCLMDAGRLAEAQIAGAHACHLLPDYAPGLMNVLNIVDYQLNKVAARERVIIGERVEYVIPANIGGEQRYFAWAPPERNGRESPNKRSRATVDELFLRSARLSAQRWGR